MNDPVLMFGGRALAVTFPAGGVEAASHILAVATATHGLTVALSRLAAEHVDGDGVFAESSDPDQIESLLVTMTEPAVALVEQFERELRRDLSGEGQS